jgi:uncharacterized RDD family membrane protein YckC
MPDAATASSDWPGKRLGLPESGPRSVGRLGRRMGGILIDWGIAYGSVLLFAQPDPLGFKTLVLFAVMQYAFLIVFNGSLGHLVFGMRVVPVDPAKLGFWRPALRTVLLCLFLPAVIFDRDQRGLHDRWSGTILVRK